MKTTITARRVRRSRSRCRPTCSAAYTQYGPVNPHEFEFSIDFANADFAGQDPAGNIPAVVVARIMISREFMPHLLDALQENLALSHPARYRGPAGNTGTPRGRFPAAGWLERRSRACKFNRWRKLVRIKDGGIFNRRNP